MTNGLQPFLECHAPYGDMDVPDQVMIDRYAALLPSCVIELWQRHGFGFYGNSGLQLINPDRYNQILADWIMLDEVSPDRIPLALSAFGTLIYYRRLSDDDDEDVSCVDPHDSTGSVLIWSAKEFFNAYLGDPDVVASLLDGALYREARERHAPLARDEIYCFTPALRLGGSRSVGSLGRGDAVVHLSLLLLLALDS